MFAQPRPKRSILPPQPKKRKAVHAVEEVAFDNEARQEYLSGFHKRKLQRVKYAQEQAAIREKEERIEIRKTIREKRKKELEEHIQNVNAALRRSEAAGAIDEQEESDSSEWGGFQDPPKSDFVDHEEEYVDEDRHTTVTIESVTIGRDGFHKPTLDSSEDEAEKKNATVPGDEATKKDKDKKHPPKKPKKKFRYESKLEREASGSKQRAKKAMRVQGQR